MPPSSAEKVFGLGVPGRPRAVTDGEGKLGDGTSSRGSAQRGVGTYLLLMVG